MPDEVLIARDGEVTWLTVNRAHRRNALGQRTVTELADCVERVAEDPETRVLVITGAGEHFGAGADLKERLGMDAPARFRHNRAIAGVVTAIQELAVPTIAAIDGYAMGGACELALACDLRILSDRAVIALSETRVGAFPGAGGTQRLSRIVGPAVAKDMILTGRQMPADEALRVGLACAIVDPAKLRIAAAQLAATVAANAPLGVAFAKKAIDLSLDVSLAAGLEFEAAALKVIFASDDYAEGLTAFSERRPPSFRGR
jgi:enoyl-CoA hydratase/carnithine racemase